MLDTRRKHFVSLRDLVEVGAFLDKRHAVFTANGVQTAINIIGIGPT